MLLLLSRSIAFTLCESLGIFSVSFAFLIYSSIRQLGSMSHVGVGVKPSHTYHSALIWYHTIHTYCGDRNDMLQRERDGGLRFFTSLAESFT